MGFAHSGGDLHLVEVADGDGGVAQGLGVEGAGRVRVCVFPENGPPVEVEDRGAGLGAVGEGREGRRAAGFLAQARARDPEDPGVADRVEVELVGVDLQVGGLGLPVEVQREVVRREDLAEGDRCGQAGDRGDPAVVHAEVPEGLVEVGAEGVVAGAGDHRRPPSEAGRGHRDVARRAAEELAEGRDLRQRDAGLERIQIHSDPPHGDQVVRHRCPLDARLSPVL